MEAPHAPFRILALDGGGIRGVCPAYYLADLEQRAGEPLYRRFDLMAGTSTGGIIAIGLALGIPAETLLDLYVRHGRRIFAKRRGRARRFVATLHKPLYPSGPLHELLRETFGENTTLGQAKTRLCVPAINVDTGKVVVFKTRHAAYLECDHRLPAWQVAAATAAAPTYFAPVAVTGRGHFVDGGLWANNPADVALVEAFRLGYAFSDVTVLSIGTGEAGFFKDTGPRRWWQPPVRSRFGLLGWGSGLVDLIMLAQAQRGENLGQQVLGPARFHRVQFTLARERAALDAVEHVEYFRCQAADRAQRDGADVYARFLPAATTPFIPHP